MSIHLVTFATDDMSRSRDLCIESAYRNGIDEGNIDPWSDGDLCELPDDDFFSKQPDDPRRALGWWSWKPAIIDCNLRGRWCKDGDILIYSDAGVEFINDVGHIMNYMDQDIFLFGNNWEHAHWCKRDVIDAIWPQSWEKFGKQVQASVIFFKVTDYSRAFVKEWLDWCLTQVASTRSDTPLGGYLIDDSPSIAPNHPEFQEHRHDQAILTTMAYREGIRLHWWPASYNDGAFNYEKLPEYAGDNYPILFNHHRRRNADWSAAA